MLAIRLARIGAKKQAAYRVVVMEKSRPRNSRSVEVVGHYNPRETPTLIELKQERVEYWLGKGAQPSDRVSRLLKVFKERPVQTVEEKAEQKKAAKKVAAKTAAAVKEKPAAEAVATAGSAAAEPVAEAVAAVGSATAETAAPETVAEPNPAPEPASGEEPKPTA